jgi:hypothetical protein
MFLTIPASPTHPCAFLAHLAAISEALDYYTVFEEPPNFFEASLRTQPITRSTQPPPKPLTPSTTAATKTPESFNCLPSCAEPSIMTRFATDVQSGLNFLAYCPNDADSAPSYCRAILVFDGNACGQLVRNGLMSKPPRRV